MPFATKNLSSSAQEFEDRAMKTAARAHTQEVFALQRPASPPTLRHGMRTDLGSLLEAGAEEPVPRALYSPHDGCIITRR